MNDRLPAFHGWSVWAIEHKHQGDRGFEEAAELEEEGAQLRVLPLLCVKTLAAESRCAVVEPDTGGSTLESANLVKD